MGEKRKKQQDQLDESYRQQHQLEHKMDELSDELRKLQSIQEEVMASQGSAHFNFKEILDLGVTKSHESFYEELVSDIESTTRDLDISFDEQLTDLKK
ncbi:hypothetical protein ACVRXQ_13050 [Streptococcus panodentis]|uniref:Uncharacterized protein n=1 Tax=Streptococcus panodentis TaxID=1581472 RepID=A0ABS5B2N4_9STRE|nr:hypothetical protein [Streptococcus panodentis]MBP2622219.1 hypothetical protein [Streptococcus panodentis]